MNPETIRHLTLARRHAHQAVTALVPASARAHLDAIAREARALLVDLLAEPAPAASELTLNDDRGGRTGVATRAGLLQTKGAVRP